MAQEVSEVSRSTCGLAISAKEQPCGEKEEIVLAVVEEEAVDLEVVAVTGMNLYDSAIMDLVREVETISEKVMVAGTEMMTETAATNAIEIKMTKSTKKNSMALMINLTEQKVVPKLMEKISMTSKESMVTKTHFSLLLLFLSREKDGLE